MDNKHYIIEGRNITVIKGEKEILKGIDIQIPLQENTAIIGPNGAGKTTLLNLLTRKIYPLAAPDSFLKLFGKDRWDIQSLRKRIGLVNQELQEEHFNHAMVKEVVLSGYYSSIGIHRHQQYSEKQKSRSLELLNELGMGDFKDLPFSNLSLGEKRRSLLARALVHGPSSLLLDEPTSGLDLKARFHFLKILRDFAITGGQVILISHHLEEIIPEIERVICLKDGKVFASGLKQDVFTSEMFSKLYDTPIELVQANGFYQVLPG